MSPARKISLSERLYRLTEKTDGCWVWKGGVSSTYGRIRADYPARKSLPVHRVAYEIEYGPIPKGMSVDHRCHNRLCVNPEHLRLATNKQNAENRSGAPANSSSGYLGVQKCRHRWQGRVQHEGRVYSVGRLFDDPQEAAEAVKALRLSLFTHNDTDRTAA